MKERFHFSDNTMVSRGKWGAEYFAVIFTERDRESPAPYEVAIYRYCVPGRCDTYHFDWTELGMGYGTRVTYYAEDSKPITKALQLLEKDLSQPRVVELLSEAVGKVEHFYFARILMERLLASVAPRHPGLRAVSRSFEKAKKERSEMIERKRAARLEEAKQLVAADAARKKSKRK